MGDAYTRQRCTSLYIYTLYMAFHLYTLCTIAWLHHIVGHCFLLCGPYTIHESEQLSVHTYNSCCSFQILLTWTNPLQSSRRPWIWCNRWAKCVIVYINTVTPYSYMVSTYVISDNEAAQASCEEKLASTGVDFFNDTDKSNLYWKHQEVMYKNWPITIRCNNHDLSLSS